MPYSNHMSIAATATMVVVMGCSAHSAKDGECHSATPAQEDYVTSGRALQKDRCPVKLIEPPEKEGMSLNYTSNIDAFNLVAATTVSPLRPKAVREYDLGHSAGAVVLTDEISDDSIILLYKKFSVEKKAFQLGTEGSNKANARGWLLRKLEFQVRQGGIYNLFDNASRVSASNDEIHEFLLNFGDTSNAFELEGHIEIEITEGYVHRISLRGIKTIASVPPNNARLRSQIELCEEQLSGLRLQAQDNPSDHLLKWSIQQESKKLQHYQNVLNEQQKAPVIFSNGRVMAKWLQKPFIDVVLP
jgi:hypothetical protein